MFNFFKRKSNFEKWWDVWIVNAAMPNGTNIEWLKIVMKQAFDKIRSNPPSMWDSRY